MSSTFFSMYTSGIPTPKHTQTIAYADSMTITAIYSNIQTSKAQYNRIYMASQLEPSQTTSYSNPDKTAYTFFTPNPT